MTLRALLFDVDGTLADTEPHGHLPAYNRAFRELGLTWRWSARLYRELLLLPTGRERLHHFLERYHPPLGRYAAEPDPDRLVRAVHAAKSRHFQYLVEKGHVPLRTGVRRLVQEAAQAGLLIAIVTNASHETLEPLLLHVVGERLRDSVSAVISGDEVVRRKPAPDLYLEALRVLGLSPTDCVAVEDSAMGLMAARGAGLRTLVTVNDFTADQVFPDAALVVDGLGEPNAPFEVIAGCAGDHHWVSIDLLRELCDRPEPAVRKAARLW